MKYAVGIMHVQGCQNIASRKRSRPETRGKIFLRKITIPSRLSPLEQSLVYEEPCTAEWSPGEQQLLERGQQVYGQDSCKIARLLGTRDCTEVASRLRSPNHRTNLPQSSRAAAPLRPKGGLRRKLNAQQPKQSQVAPTRKS